MSDVIQPYIDAGWALTPIPPGGKSPGVEGWNLRMAALKRSADLHPSFGVGLLHAYSGTMALDVDDWTGTTLYGIDVAALYQAPDAVTIISGKPGRGKLLYRMPFSLPTKKFEIEVPNGNADGTIRHTLFELRCGTLKGLSAQDLLPPSIHPEMGTPYQWGGAGHWSNLPMIPEHLLDIWQAALVDVRPVRVDGIDSSWEEITEALAYISPDCSRDEWVKVGMSLHWAGDYSHNSEQAFHIWNNWSRNLLPERMFRYPGENAMVAQWRSFRTTKSISVTLGTVFHMARKKGWTRATPDASTLFEAITPTTPTDIMQILRPTPPPPEMDLWPSILATRAQEISDGVGCDPLVPLWAGLGAVCGVIDARIRLELMDGFKVPPVLWLMTLGEPADKKTPGSRPMLEPLSGIESEDRKRYAQSHMEWEVKNAAYASAKKAMLEFARTEEYLLGGEAPPVPAKPDDPVPLKITCNDITSQALVRVATGRPRGLLCYLDEMSSWVNKMINKQSGDDRSCWVVAYEAARYEMDRVTSGPSHAENFAVSIYGNIQPRVFRENFDSMAQDGLLQRFLPAVLRGDQTRLGHPVPAHLTTADEWERTLRTIFALPAWTYRLSPEAHVAFRSFQAWYEKRKVQERLVQSSGTFMTAFGKLEGLVGRLALVFHVIERPYESEVSVDTLRRVIRLVKRYVLPVYRHLYDNTETSSTMFDAWVMEYLIQYADQDRISLTKLKRAARRQWEKNGIKQNAEQNMWVLNAMYMLASQGWVHRIDDGSGEVKGEAEWLINPYIRTTFEDYRNAVIKARQSMIDATHDKLRPLAHGSEDLPDD